ncbi:hypothetical protein K2F43_04410 [Clostridium estertheticum]|uniref:hypothetical protein n=1 Tax=Clostridium estertheticum TaxID=238834 RepID=UPI001C6F29C1|nr:hypothetical protein [Clostridium estertheticum]MBW9170448.1 hypothetical protein [Clostridium estertheticum]WLC75091.1 hypothetical protein KTC99_20595 [Clostridium estertheticum]
MKEKIKVNLLGFYDLVLALGAIYIGVMMISSRGGVFTQYPKEWLSKVPFDNWIAPGIITIVLFGLGNIIAAILSFRKGNSKFWVVSVIMGVLLFISIISQVIILEETFLATVEIMLLSIIQLCICGYAFVEYRKKHNKVQV